VYDYVVSTRLDDDNTFTLLGVPPGPSVICVVESDEETGIDRIVTCGDGASRLDLAPVLTVLPGQDITGLVFDVTPYGPATDLTALGSTGTVELDWTPPAAGVHAIVDWVVQMSVEGGPWADVEDGAGVGSSATVTGLSGGESRFRVAAVRSYGRDPYSDPVGLSVVPAEVPGAPTGVSGVRGNGQVSVSWSAPASTGGSAITGYVVTAAPGGATCSTSGALSCSVSGLVNGSAYTFTVVASNAVGAGAASAASDPVTPAAPPPPVAPAVVPGAPTNVVAVRTDTSATVSWSVPAEDGGSDIIGYLVTASPGGATCQSTGAPSCVVPELSDTLAYTFTVVAENSVGRGPASLPSDPTPVAPSAPVAVSSLPADSRITVSWSAPLSDGGSPITGYRAVAQPGGASCTTSGARSCVITGLVNGTVYELSVVASNVVGASVPAAAAGPGSMPFRLPGAPVDLTGVEGNQRVFLSWSRPASSGTPALTGYDVQRLVGQTWTTVEVVDASTTSLVVTSLENGTPVRFRVLARSDLGSSGASNTVSVTPRTDPGAPRRLEGDVGRRSILLTWREPADDGGARIVDYVVQISSDGSSWRRLRAGEGTSTRERVTGLTPNTVFFFRVAAVNDVGRGGWSNTTAVRTPR
jgi:hypothetical protein